MKIKTLTAMSIFVLVIGLVLFAVPSGWTFDDGITDLLLRPRPFLPDPWGIDIPNTRPRTAPETPPPVELKLEMPNVKTPRIPKVSAMPTSKTAEFYESKKLHAFPQSNLDRNAFDILKASDIPKAKVPDMKVSNIPKASKTAEFYESKKLREFPRSNLDSNAYDMPKIKSPEKETHIQKASKTIEFRETKLLGSNLDKNIFWRAGQDIQIIDPVADFHSREFQKSFVRSIPDPRDVHMERKMMSDLKNVFDVQMVMKDIILGNPAGAVIASSLMFVNRGRESLMSPISTFGSEHYIKTIDDGFRRTDLRVFIEVQKLYTLERFKWWGPNDLFDGSCTTRIRTHETFKTRSHKIHTPRTSPRFP